ncbi:MAG: hypothetical protein GSR85_09070 [Desulfurococcales archaeon]|nr:hypothetical protein [Desulfurococcales archaeon]
MGLSTMANPGFSEDEMKSIRDVARGLSYFARERMYRYIDRIADAFSPQLSVAALREALRVLNSEYSRGEPVYLPSKESVEKVIKLMYSRRDVGDVLAALALSWTPAQREGRLTEGR